MNWVLVYYSSSTVIISEFYVRIVIFPFKNKAADRVVNGIRIEFRNLKLRDGVHIDINVLRLLLALVD